MLGLIFFAFNYACVFWAEQRVASGYAALISATMPVWIFIGEWLWLGTVKPAGAATLGMASGIAGVALLAAPRGAPGTSLAACVLLTGAFAWTFATLWSRRLQVPKSRVSNAGIQMLTGGIALLALSAAVGEINLLREALTNWNWRLTVDMAYLVIAASILAFLAFVWLIDREPASRVSSYAYVNPLIAVILGALVAGERLTRTQQCGAAFVLLGVVVTLRSRTAARA